MEAYVTAINYAIPFFLILIFIEIIASKLMHQNVIRSMDMLASLSSGVTNVIKDVLGLTVIIVSYRWMVENMALVEIKATWLVYVIGFIGLDFSGYWVHRIAHQVNYFWNHHIVHHSSEEFNLGCALRQSISNWFSISFIFMVPTALLGIPAEVIAVIAPLHLFAQYWYHTRLIGKLGILEYVIVTPSHHRVHHAINPEYLDKNLSQIFIIWDMLFGTFQKELDDIPPVYGVKRPVKTWNPFIINFMHLWLIIKDAWRTKSWWSKLKIWFMPTGWRPADVKDRFPVDTIDNVFDQIKFDPRTSSALQFWSWFQFVLALAGMLHCFNFLGEISLTEAFVYAGFLYVTIFSYTTLMDGKSYAIWTELLRSFAGLSIIHFYGDWFLLNEYFPMGSIVVSSYLLVSPIVTYYFIRTKQAIQVRPV